MKLWETLIETEDHPEDEVLAADETLEEEVEAEALVEEMIVAHERCLSQPAAIAKKSVRYLLDPQTVSQCTAVSVLKK